MDSTQVDGRRARPDRLAARLACLACLGWPLHGQDQAIDADEATRQLKVAHLLADGTWYQRSEAADALQSAGRHAATAAPLVLDTAVKAIASHDWRLAQLTIDTLAAISPDALAGCCDAIAVVLGGSDADAKLQAMRLVTQIGRKAATLEAHLITLAQDNELGLPALRTLVAVGATVEAVPLLRRSLSSSDSDAVRCAIAGFAEVGARSSETVPALTALLGNADHRAAALSALAGLGHDASAASAAVAQASLAVPNEQRGDFIAALRAIETEDIPPTCQDAAVTCVEGGDGARADLAIADPDDAAAELHASLLAKPAHGTLSFDGLTAVYRAPYGWTGSERIPVQVTDHAGKSATATLTATVAPDQAPPTLRDMWMLEMDHTVVRLVFTKPLQKASAEIPQSYAIAPSVTVAAASLGTDRSTVDLKVAGLQSGKPYALTVQGVLSAATTPVPIACAAQAFTAKALKPGLVMQYFDKEDFATAAGTSLALNVDFPDGPKANTEHYSARLTGWLTPDADDAYTIQITSDDGSRLWLDDQQVIDDWGDHGPTDKACQVALVHGHRYKIRIDYYNNAGPEFLRLQWSRPGQPMEVIPAKALSHDE